MTRYWLLQVNFMESDGYCLKKVVNQKQMGSEPKIFFWGKTHITSSTVPISGVY